MIGRILHNEAKNMIIKFAEDKGEMQDREIVDEDELEINETSAPLTSNCISDKYLEIFDKWS